MSRATPPVALSFREFLVKILKPENDGVLELVKMFPAIQTQPVYTFSKAERVPRSWLRSLASSIG